jgi:Bacterial aa3 type cytochrome c oxidase subunit IV
MASSDNNFDEHVRTYREFVRALRYVIAAAAVILLLLAYFLL